MLQSAGTNMMQAAALSAGDFKSWFAGFSEHIETAPTPEQWNRIRQQVSLIGGSPQLITGGAGLSPLDQVGPWLTAVSNQN